MKHSKKVSFSIAESYDSEEGYWTYKGMQAWCTAKIYSRSKNPKPSAVAVKKMDLKKSLQKLGLKELPPHINYRINELEPDKIKYGNPTEELPGIKKDDLIAGSGVRSVELRLGIKKGDRSTVPLF
jgi:hypothetical protein